MCVSDSLFYVTLDINIIDGWGLGNEVYRELLPEES